MRYLKQIAFAVLTLACVGCGNDRNSPPNNFHRYYYKNIHLTYNLVGDARGTEDLYIADYGKYEARYSKYEALTEKGVKPVDNAGITRFTDSYEVDYLNKTVLHTRVTSLDSLYHLSEGSIPSPDEYVAASMHDNAFRNDGTDTVRGVGATVWYQHDSEMKLWVWHSLLLKKFIRTRDNF